MILLVAIFRRQLKVAMTVFFFELLQLLMRWSNEMLIVSIAGWRIHLKPISSRRRILSSVSLKGPFCMNYHIWTLHVTIDLKSLEDLFLLLCNMHVNAYFIARPFRCFHCYKLRSICSATDSIRQITHVWYCTVILMHDYCCSTSCRKHWGHLSRTVDVGHFESVLWEMWIFLQYILLYRYEDPPSGIDTNSEC